MIQWFLFVAELFFFLLDSTLSNSISVWICVIFYRFTEMWKSLRIRKISNLHTVCLRQNLLCSYLCIRLVLELWREVCVGGRGDVSHNWRAREPRCFWSVYILPLLIVHNINRLYSGKLCIRYFLTKQHFWCLFI